LRGKKRPYPCFSGQRIDKSSTIRSTIRASRLSCQASTEYWSIQTTFSLYTYIFASCESRDATFKKLSRLSSKASLTVRLTRFLMLKSFVKPLSYDPNRVQELEI